MTILDLIEKKKNNLELEQKEFDWFIKNILNKSVANYQISAFLMAIWINGLTKKETFYLTDAIIKNGETLTYPINDSALLIDKHSTGGIGDKVSLILLPILASFGIKTVKLSGKGLGYSGGTIDKLHSIGVETNLSEEKRNKVLLENNFFIMEQTANLVPADKILYSLRDVTGTVDSVSLIAASIMSKKIATNSNVIYLDLKTGDGSFFSSSKKSTELASLCLYIGRKYKKKVVVHFTDMSIPLGRAIGNLIEVNEAYNFLNDYNYDSFNLKSLIYEFATDILVDQKLFSSKKEAKKAIVELHKSKKFVQAFEKWVKAQNSTYDLRSINNLYEKKSYIEIKANKSGYVNFLSNKVFGYCLIDLKGGRKKTDDLLDYESGIYLVKSDNEFVKKNQVIMRVYGHSSDIEKVINTLNKNIKITTSKKKKWQPISKVMV